MLVHRVLSAIVLVPIIVAAAALGGAPFWAIVLAASGIAMWELTSLLRRAGYSPIWVLSLVLGIAFILDPAVLPGRIVPPALSASLLLSLLFLVLRQRVETGLIDWAVTWVPPLYVGFLASFLVSIRLLPDGDRWIFLVAGTTWSTDIGAYLVGIAAGRRKFFPLVSPRKSQEGAVAGLVAGVGAALLLGWLFGWDLLRLGILGLLSSLAAEAGDLAESLMKRQLGTKDAGNLIPGHGGMLDRMDSLLFVGVVTYWWAIWIGAGS